MTPMMHPQYMNLLHNWRKWRLVYAGGDVFISEYLKQFSGRENDQDYAVRLCTSYPPSFAKAAVNEIKNAIYQRLSDVVRVGGSQSYQEAAAGDGGGVDFNGSSMTAFIGRKVLPELLSMGKCGVFIDMPPDVGQNLFDSSGKRPYLYVYEVADIYNWTLDPDTADFKSLLLKDRQFKFDDVNGLPLPSSEMRFRWITIVPDGMQVEFQNNEGKTLKTVVVAGMKRIPFVVFNLEDSLLSDVADYQISLLNIASGDVSYCMRANFPIYTEQHDSRLESNHLRQGQPQQSVTAYAHDVSAAGAAGTPVPPQQGTAASNVALDKEIATGVGRGRMYPMGAERPGFVHPSPDPLYASMEKQEQMKKEIRQLVHLAVANQAQSSAESKQQDATGLEAGLSAIGTELERGERLIAGFWETYESYKDQAVINYPRDYECKSDEDRRKEAKEAAELIEKVPSQTYQREMGKKIARTLLGHRLPRAVIEQIEAEIDASKGITSSIKDLMLAVENGVMSAKTASNLIGAPAGDVDDAKDEHAARLARIQAAQMEGSGVAGGIAKNMAAGQAPIADAQESPGAAKSDKKTQKDKTKFQDLGSQQRGAGKRTMGGDQ